MLELFLRGFIPRRAFSTRFPARQLAKALTESNEVSGAKPDVFASDDYFRVHNLFTVKDMFDARVHLGHKEVSVDKRMKPFIFGSRLGHVVFDLDITAYYLREALNFSAHVAYRDGIILFVSSNKRCTTLVENTAKECGEYAAARQWRKGTFTSSVNIFKCLTRLPDLCIILNTIDDCGHEHDAVVESARLLIPTVGIVDSNCNPNLITYPVPGNDDTPSSLSFYCSVFQKAIMRGKAARREHANISQTQETSSTQRPVENT